MQKVYQSPPPVCTWHSGRAQPLSYDVDMFEVAFIRILFAGVASLVIGFVWYHPKVFGGAWTRMTNLSPEMVERGKKRMPLTALAGLIASMLVAYVMNY